MNIISTVILVILSLLNGLMFFMMMTAKHTDETSKIAFFFSLVIAIGCIMTLFKKKVGFAFAAIAVLCQVLIAAPEGAPGVFIGELIILCIAVYLPKDGVSLWKQLK